MSFLNDKKNTPIVIVIALLAIGGAAASCVHFLGIKVGPSAPELTLTPPLGPQPGKPHPMPGHSVAPDGGEHITLPQ